MHVRMISFGSNWWAARRRGEQPAWFNSAGLKHGRRIDFCWIFKGQVRFNRSSGFHPEFRQRAIGSTFVCDSPQIHEGRLHLLVTQKAPMQDADRYLVTVTDCIHGQICFERPGWSSPALQPISISRKRERYEAVLLMGLDDWLNSDLGRWQISRATDGLVLLADQSKAVL